MHPMTPRPLREVTAKAVAMLLAAGLAACAPMTAGGSVTRGADMARYRTWDWAPATEQPTGDPRLDSNPFFAGRMRSAVERQMLRRGYVRGPFTGPPTLLVHYHANFSRTFEITNGAPAMGSCSRNCEPEAYAYEQGTLVIDAVDVKTNALVWRGWSRDNMEGVIDNQKRMDREIDAVVAAIFEYLPAVP